MERRLLRVIVLLAILLAATALRLHALGTEPWYDEIVTHLRCARLSGVELATTYDSQNQHVLYSLLARLSLVIGGDTTAALRTPAAIFGVLSIGALYLLARSLVSAREALLAAALLSVSYHHVWFSQNARGYTALLFWTLLATWILLRAAAHERRWEWAAYGLVAALGAYTHLTMLFVVAGHLLWYLRRVPRLDHGLTYGFGLVALLVLFIYAPMLPQVFAVTASEGRDPHDVEVGAAWASRALIGGVSDAFPHPGVRTLALLLACAGMWRLERAHSGITELFALPVVIAVVVVLAFGHHPWPRLLFFAIGFGAFAVICGATIVGDAVGRLGPGPWGEVVGVGLALTLVAVSMASVPRAYAPKQRFQEALALVNRERDPGDAVAAVGGAATVYRDYYHADWERIGTLDELAEVRMRAARTWVVHTFPSHLLARGGDLAERLESDFALVARFDASLQGGSVLVWRGERPERDLASAPESPGGSDSAAIRRGSRDGG